MGARPLMVGACLALGCAGAPARPPELPPQTDVETLIGPRPPIPAVPEGLPGGRDRNIDDGQCKGLPAGIWVSERKYAERIAAIAERDRLRTEVEAYRKLRRQELSAMLDFEAAARVVLDEAETRAERRLWIGVLVGVGVTLAGGWLATQAVR